MFGNGWDEKVNYVFQCRSLCVSLILIFGSIQSGAQTVIINQPQFEVDFWFTKIKLSSKDNDNKKD